MTILLLFVGVFAVIGLLTSLYAALEAFCYGRGEPTDTEVVIFVKDCQDSIEGTVRSYAARLKSGLCSIEAEMLAVVDRGSTDETGIILSRLEREISILKVYTVDEYIEKCTNKKSG